MSQVLMDAVRSNDVDVLRRVVAEDPSLVNYRDEDGNSASTSGRGMMSQWARPC